MGHLLPCAMVLAHLLSGSSLVSFLSVLEGGNCVPRVVDSSCPKVEITGQKMWVQRTDFLSMAEVY